ncbi:phosphate acetyltransferase [Acinetobacter rathckeae]|uniref:phosphate acetyltransferase n=1 Tax=Acinetobacter rathckeae TaxID=2605272 RepID=UPI0018A2C46A|nr:phosphate acetyltransferase [Acinetobacter rathckeae]MBF7688862.1 phosphate acetyltransferase [Acinetobacter rathckeae]MBF7696422.1 phosphate acetyltransferase [Acinetobacter rathckeae]
MNTLLLIPTKESVGLTSASLGLIYALDCNGIQSSFLKSFESAHSQTVALYQQLFHDIPVATLQQQQVLDAMASNHTDELLEETVRLHRHIAQSRDVVVVEGLPPLSDSYASQQFNLQLAKALNAKILFVSEADLTAPKQTALHLEANLKSLGGLENNRVMGVLFMRTKGLTEQSAQIPVTLDPSLRLVQETQHFSQQLQQYSQIIATPSLPIVGLVPFSNILSVPRTLDIADALNATWLNQGKAKKRRVLGHSLISSHIDVELTQFTAGQLIITASERTDVLLASSMATQNGIPLAGLVLAEREAPQTTIMDFCQPALEQGLPILHTPLSPLEAIQHLKHLNYDISIQDLERAQKVSRFVGSHIDQTWLATYTQHHDQARLSPAAFRYELVQKSIAHKKRIVLPEGDEPRTVEAAIICQTRGLAQCVLLAKPEAVHDIVKARQLTLPPDLEIIDPDQIKDRYAEAMVERRKGKLVLTQAQEQLKDTVVLGTMMLALNEVDGLVSGAVHTTANTVRPAFQLIKTAPEYSLVSSIFFMLLPDEVYVYGDCAINPNPNAEQLAEIAIQSADSAKAFGIEPRIAMISYSTGSSGAGADVEKVTQATQIVREKRPDLVIDGPLQYDAASVESVGKSKAPDSQVAGKANVYIFPDLNTGNTTYKAVQRSANVISVGPMLQGLNKPVNDLSRGALVDDIVFTIALTAIQAEQ